MAAAEGGDKPVGAGGAPAADRASESHFECTAYGSGARTERGVPPIESPFSPALPSRLAALSHGQPSGEDEKGRGGKEVGGDSNEIDNSASLSEEKRKMAALEKQLAELRVIDELRMKRLNKRAARRLRRRGLMNS